jgi:hypothetical protein
MAQTQSAQHRYRAQLNLFNYWKMSFWRPSTIAKVYLSSFMCKTGFLRSLNYQIRLFLVPRLFWRWFSHDIATTRYITIKYVYFWSLNYQIYLFFPLTLSEGDIRMT